MPMGIVGGLQAMSSVRETAMRLLDSLSAPTRSPHSAVSSLAPQWVSCPEL
jgi:hypothetical protein